MRTKEQSINYFFQDEEVDFYRDLVGIDHNLMIEQYNENNVDGFEIDPEKDLQLVVDWCENNGWILNKDF